jgi:putative transposase
LNPDLRGRRSIRLKGWDYSSPGWYFVTLCVQNRESLFGHFTNNIIVLTDSGKMIQSAWLELPGKYPGITRDEFIIMPNHIHAILGLYVGAGPRACPSGSSDRMDSIVQKNAERTRGAAPTNKRLSLPDVIRAFKTWTMRKYSEGISQFNWPEFQKHLWQRNYYEHIIRNERELEQTRQYIRDNPAAWPQDEENPEKVLCV